jgi:hypothetical protein
MKISRGRMVRRDDALPPGASAPVPEVVNPWSLPPLGVTRRGGLLGLGRTLGNQGTLRARGGKQVEHVSSQSIVSDDDDALLAYVLNADADADDGEGFLGGRRGDRHSLGGQGGVGGGATLAQPRCYRIATLRYCCHSTRYRLTRYCCYRSTCRYSAAPITSLNDDPGHQRINGRRWREGTGQARQVRW